MTETQKIQWQRLTMEAVAIIASILFAFGIDAWWDGVRADRETREILKAVQLEMDSNLAALRDSISHHLEIVAAIDTAQDQMSSDGVQFTAVIDVEVFEPNTGALDTLIAAGMLGEFKDPALQISLGAFSGFAKDLAERELRAVEFRDAARRRIAAIGEPIWDAADPGRVRSDVHMLNLLTMRQAEEAAAIESAQRLERHLLELLSQLQSTRSM